MDQVRSRLYPYIKHAFASEYADDNADDDIQSHIHIHIQVHALIKTHSQIQALYPHTFAAYLADDVVQAHAQIKTIFLPMMLSDAPYIHEHICVDYHNVTPDVVAFCNFNL